MVLTPASKTVTAGVLCLQQHFGGQLHMVQLLLQHGCDINVTDNSQRTLLIEAAHAGAERVAEFLIQQGLSVHAVDAQQQTPLHCAAAQSRTAATMQLLLAHSAAVNARAYDGLTPLHSAAIAGQLQNAEAPLAAGADATCRAQCWTPLNLAVEGSYAALVQLLLEHGAAAAMNSVQLHL
jgi:uncharacterized protein